MTRLLPLALAVAAMVPSARPMADARDRSTESVYLTAVASAGHLVGDLRREEVAVLEEGVPRDVSELAPAGPLTIVLLLDTSPSIAYVSKVDEIVGGMAAVLRAGDRMTIGRFGPDIVIDPVFTRDGAGLRDAARSAWDRERDYAGPSPLWDALNTAIGALESEPGRRVVIVVTDGKATGSLTTFSAVVRHAVLANVEVDAIVPGLPAPGLSGPRGLAPGSSGGRGLPGPRAGIPGVAGMPDTGLMRPWERPLQIADQTGGLAMNPGATDKDVRDRFARLMDELQAEYRVDFQPAARDGRPHTLSVQVKRTNVTTRARKSYIAPM